MTTPMEPRLKKKALLLWEVFAATPFELDAEAAHALMLRDELERGDLTSEEYGRVLELDARAFAQAARLVEDLKRCGQFRAVEYWRAHGETRSGRWWWLDDVAAGNVTRTLARQQPLARAESHRAVGIEGALLPLRPMPERKGRRAA